MKIEIQITKGKFWSLAVLALLAIGIFVLAAAPNPGHTADEIDGLTELGNRVTKVEEMLVDPWPEGSYCIWKKGNCPSGFQEASLSIDAEDEGGWETGGPIGESRDTGGDNVILVACCK
ncbi:hypothetical protein HY496_03165 [Candidatus Woesearchaeota archaeon]|nr:hypothetical protein [Candidatus Woesearchaeota archaeon]